MIFRKNIKENIRLVWRFIWGRERVRNNPGTIIPNEKVPLAVPFQEVFITIFWSSEKAVDEARFNHLSYQPHCYCSNYFKGIEAE